MHTLLFPYTADSTHNSIRTSEMETQGLLTEDNQRSWAELWGMFPPPIVSLLCYDFTYQHSTLPAMKRHRPTATCLQGKLPDVSFIWKHCFTTTTFQVALLLQNIVDLEHVHTALRNLFI
jgi:hypothetical protein